MDKVAKFIKEREKRRAERISKNEEVRKIDSEIENLEAQIENLRKKKLEHQINDIFAGMEEGKYYYTEIHSSYYYFKYTKDNVFLQDGEGTVGYDGDNWLIIEDAIYSFTTRTSRVIGFQNHVVLHASAFNPNSICPSKFFEVSEEEFFDEIEGITEMPLFKEYKERNK